MSKKKNTLNDLEEFLKLQASTLVVPSSLAEKVEPAIKVEVESKVSLEKELSEKELVEKIKTLAKDKSAFYNLIISATENLPNKSKDDTLLINTALYLKSGASWKDAIRNYWESKK
jgi:hypothetical protein